MLQVLEINNSISTEWNIEIDTNERNVLYKIDTGAQVNVLPKSEFKKLTPRLL